MSSLRALIAAPSRRAVRRESPFTLLWATAVLLVAAVTPGAGAAEPVSPGGRLPEVNLDLLPTGASSESFLSTSLGAWEGGKPRLFLYVLPGQRASDLEIVDVAAFGASLKGKLSVALITFPKAGVVSPKDLKEALGPAAAGLPTFRDTGFALGSALGLNSAPSYVLVDSDGTLRVIGARALAAPVPPSGVLSDLIRSGLAAGSLATVTELPLYKPNQRLVGRAFVDLALPRLDTNQRVKLGDWVGKGKAVLLVFWSVRCPHCTKEMPHFASVLERYAEKLDFVTVARAADGAMEQETKQYLAGKSLSFPVLVDSSGDAMDRYLVSATPTTVLIRADGNVAAVESGEIENLATWIDRILPGSK